MKPVMMTSSACIEKAGWNSNLFFEMINHCDYIDYMDILGFELDLDDLLIFHELKAITILTEWSLQRNILLAIAPTVAFYCAPAKFWVPCH